MKHWKLYSLILACALVAGCTKSARSISHSGYTKPGSYCQYPPGDGASDPAFEYHGELSEADVLGISRGEITSDAEIRRTREAAKPVKLRPGSSILLIQSGALFPDELRQNTAPHRRARRHRPSALLLGHARIGK